MEPKDNTPFSLHLASRPIIHQINPVYSISCKAFNIYFNIIFPERLLVLNGVFQSTIQQFVPNDLVSQRQPETCQFYLLMIYLMTHSVYQIIASVVRMEFETMYAAAFLAYFVFGQNNICYLTKLTLVVITCMWSVMDEGMGVEQC